MERPIRNTPILYRKDATEFLLRINGPIPPEVKRKAREEMEEGAKRFREMFGDIEL